MFIFVLDDMSAVAVELESLEASTENKFGIGVAPVFAREQFCPRLSAVRGRSDASG
jgi:hypothetical protein